MAAAALVRYPGGVSRPLAFAQCAAGIAVLCVMDAIVKHLAATNAVVIVTLGRYITGTALAALVWAWQGRQPITRQMLPLHVLRGVILAAMATSFYYGLTVLTLAETITIAFIAPLLVPPLARLALKEPMQPRYVAAGLLGFVGVIVTAGGAPDFDSRRLLALAAVLFSAVAYAGNIVLMRARAASDGATVMTLMGAIVPMLVLSPAAIGAVLPDTTTLAWMVLMGLVGNIGMQLISRAYAKVEAQALAVLEFTGLPWAALFGWLFFAEAVRPQIWAGAAIIAAASIWAMRMPAPALKAG